MCKTIDLKHFLNNLYLVFSVGNFQGLNFRFHVQNLRATLANYHKLTLTCFNISYTKPHKGADKNWAQF